MRVWCLPTTDKGQKMGPKHPLPESGVTVLRYHKNDRSREHIALGKPVTTLRRHARDHALEGLWQPQHQEYLVAIPATGSLFLHPLVAPLWPRELIIRESPARLHPGEIVPESTTGWGLGMLLDDHFDCTRWQVALLQVAELTGNRARAVGIHQSYGSATMEQFPVGLAATKRALMLFEDDPVMRRWTRTECD